MSLPRKAISRIKLRIPAGQAKPSPAIGQALGSLGINMMKFCKDFNERSEKFTPGMELRVKLRAYGQDDFEYDVMMPRTTWFLQTAANVTKGPEFPGKSEDVGSIHVKQLYEIAVLKAMDPNQDIHSVEGIARSLAASCKSCGLTIDNSVRDDSRQKQKEPETERNQDTV